MAHLLVVRLFQTGLVLLGLIAVVVVLTRISGSPVRAMMGESAAATEEAIAELEKEYGLGKPIYQQYFIYLGQLLRGNIGRSITSRRPALEIFAERFPSTLKLAGVTLLIVIPGGIALGTLAAFTKGGLLDTTVRLASAVAQAAPSFWIATVLILVFGVWLDWAPFGGDRGWAYVILPAIAFALYPLAAVLRITRTSVLNVLGEEYVMVARAKGLREWTVVTRHVLRNALLAIVTYVGLIVAAMIVTGTLVIEVIFGWPGVGLRAFTAVVERDHGLLQAFVLIFGAIYALANLLVDLSYGYLDPRTRGDRGS